jgi:ParB-like chromosome segregation protein Spo0J
MSVAKSANDASGRKPVLNWRADPDAEFVLREIVNLAWQEELIALSQIDWQESANNCARLSEPLLHSVIEEYHSSMARGDFFPMIVVEKGDNGYIILGGNQRTNAVKKFGDESLLVRAYVVDPLTSANRELVIRSLNSRHGSGATKQERLQHAAYLVQDKGVSVSVAAHAMCVSDVSVLEYVKANEVRADLAKKGVASSVLSISHLSALARVKDQSRRLQIAKAAIEHRATADQVQATVRGVLDAKSPAAAQKVVASNAKVWSETQKVRSLSKSTTNKRRTKFLNLLDTMVAFLETANNGQAVSTMDDVSCSPTIDGDKIRVCVAKITARLHCIVESGK